MRVHIYHHVAGAKTLDVILAELKTLKAQGVKLMGDTQQLIVETNRTKDLVAKLAAALQAAGASDQPQIDAAVADLKAANDAAQALLPQG